MIVIKPEDQSETKTLLVLVSRGPGRPQYENDTGGCGTLFLMGGGGGQTFSLAWVEAATISWLPQEL